MGTGSTPQIQEETENGPRDIFEGVREAIGERRFVSDKPLSRTNYAVAILPRTGSTALCSLLERTAVLGYPDEYLNPRGPMQTWARQLAAADLTEYVEALRRERVTPNGVFGLKAAYQDLEPFLSPGSEMTSTLLGDLEFVYLTREDVVAQAVSEYIAEETGLWHRDRRGKPWHSVLPADAATLERDEANAEAISEGLELDEERVIRITESFAEMSERWERFFKQNSVDPLRITYEQFCADPSRAVREVAARLGINWDGKISLSLASTSRLADERNRDWVRRVRARLAP